MRCWIPARTRRTSRSATPKRRPVTLGLAALFLGGVLGGCGLLRDGPGYDAIDLIDATYTNDEQRQIGLEFDRSLRQQARFIDDALVTDFIEDLGQQIVARTGDQPFVYRFRVIEDPSLNAFAVFGGYVYIHSGTLLAAGTIDELAGVMGHEVAHVRMDHHARIHARTKIPDLLARAAALAGAGATGSPEVYAGAMGINVALQLHFSRKLEAEADHHGADYMAAAGFDPAGITRFFQRIVAEQQRSPDLLPPYLYSHPDVEERIAYVESRATALERTGARDNRLTAQLPEVQARLAAMRDTDRASLTTQPSIAGNIIGPLLRASARMKAEGRLKRALEMLRRAEHLEPNDPRIYFERGELQRELGRNHDAELAFRRTIELDPARALPFYRLAQTLEAQGHRSAAVHSYERAIFRAGANGQLRKRAEWAVKRLTFDEWDHCRTDPGAALPANQANPEPASLPRATRTKPPCPGTEAR